MILLGSKKLLSKRSCFRVGRGKSGGSDHDGGIDDGCDIIWEVRPGGMLVQKRECGKGEDGLIIVRISTGSSWHDVSIGATSTFGELKMAVSMVTGLEPREQRLIFKGKEREDGDHLHMVGVRDKDKMLLLEDPAIKERKLRSRIGVGGGSRHTNNFIIEV